MKGEDSVSQSSSVDDNDDNDEDPLPITFSTTVKAQTKKPVHAQHYLSNGPLAEPLYAPKPSKYRREDDFRSILKQPKYVPPKKKNP